MQNVIFFTKKGYEDKQKEYAELLAKRPDAVKELTKARDMGDLSENGYYKGARFKLSDIDRQLRHLKHLLKVGRVKESSQSGIDIGSIVTLSDGITERTYEIVGTYEASPSEGKISLDAPLGKALFGKKEGETAQLVIGGKTTKFRVVKIT